MVETGVVHGRFQILHLKHMEYMLAAKMRCRMMYVGITHPDISAYPASSPIDTHGTTKRDNPLTYLERYEMIRDALLDFGVKRDEFEIVPFPVSHPEMIREYVPEGAVHYMSLYSEWDEERNRILQAQGFKVEILWKKDREQKEITGTLLRDRIARDEDWQQYMPKTACEYVTAHGLDQRIRQLFYTYAPPGK